MKSRVPPTDHVSRWCKPSQVEDGIIGISAFMLEGKDKDNAISVNWLEFLKKPDRNSEIAEIRQLLSKKMNGVSKNSRIAVLNVGNAITEVDKSLDGSLTITVLHSPDSLPGKWDDPSHSGIHGLTRGPDDQAAATALRDAISEVHSAT